MYDTPIGDYLACWIEEASQSEEGPRTVNLYYARKGLELDERWIFVKAYFPEERRITLNRYAGLTQSRLLTSPSPAPLRFALGCTLQRFQCFEDGSFLLHALAAKVACKGSPIARHVRPRFVVQCILPRILMLQCV